MPLALRHSAALLFALLCATPALPHAACAQAARSAAVEPSWDGLERLQQLASDAHVELLAPKEVSLSRVRASDALLIVGPRKALPVAALSAFLREGGRVGLLDDFGSGGRFLSAYQVERAEAPRSGPALRNDARLLIAYPRSDHPLAEGVPLLVTNEASALRHPDLKPVFVFGAGSSALALAGAVGAGRLVAVGDASLVINQMMALPSHQRFAHNLLDYLSRAGGKIWLVGPSTAITGSYGRSAPSGAAWLDGWLKRLARPDLPPSVLLLFAFSAAAIAAVIAINALPRKSPYLRTKLFPDDTVYAGFAGRVALSRQPGSNLLWPVLDLQHEFEAELSHLLGLQGRVSTREALAAAYRKGWTKPQLAELEQLLTRLSELASQAENDTERPAITAPQLRELVLQSEALLSRLGSDAKA